MHITLAAPYAPGHVVLQGVLCTVASAHEAGQEPTPLKRCAGGRPVQTVCVGGGGQGRTGGQQRQQQQGVGGEAQLHVCVQQTELPTTCTMSRQAAAHTANGSSHSC